MERVCARSGAARLEEHSSAAAASLREGMEELFTLQRLGVRDVARIADPQAARRSRERLGLESRNALQRASATTQSQSGKALLRKRGEPFERGFAHTPDCGGLRRVSLRGSEKLTKRQLCGALTHNLSLLLLLLRLFGIGTLKQALAAPAKPLASCSPGCGNRSACPQACLVASCVPAANFSPPPPVSIPITAQ